LNKVAPVIPPPGLNDFQCVWISRRPDTWRPSTTSIPDAQAGLAQLGLHRHADLDPFLIAAVRGNEREAPIRLSLGC